MDAPWPFSTLSIVIPAYDEAGRLPRFLGEVREDLERLPPPGGYEVVVVDDGSRDGTSSVVGRIASGWRQLRLVRHPVNRGKGAALATGIAASSGEAIALLDADGAAPLAEARRLAGAVERGGDVAVGIRDTGCPATTVRRARHRALSGRAFAWCVREVFRLPVSDTQCGCKVLRRAVAARVLPLCREEGYLFELELLAQAHRLGYRLVEVPIGWTETPGSKVRLVRDACRMLLGLARVRSSLATSSSAPAMSRGPLAPPERLDSALLRSSGRLP